MSIKAILFDLDGTLLPMDQDVFIKQYLMAISSDLSSRGYEPSQLAENIMRCTYFMIKNDGTQTNEKVFWKHFCELYGEQSEEDEKHFNQFYIDRFDKLSKYTSPTERAREAVMYAKERGLRTVLATNPVFPRIAVNKRMAWAGLAPADFELVTSYEVSHYCKPNPDYYKEILERLGLEAEECIMVGNDARDDMAASLLGVHTFLLTDHLINPKDVDISIWRNGSFDELIKYMEEMI